MLVPAYCHEDVLTDPKFDNDPRAILLRKPCRKCGAARGIYCRTPSGFRTLHKTRGGAP